MREIEYTSMKHGPISREEHGKFQAGRVDPIHARLNRLPMSVQGWVNLDRIQRDPRILPEVKGRLGVAKVETYQSMTPEERMDLREFQQFEREEREKTEGNKTAY